jgi:hypothetical protein
MTAHINEFNAQEPLTTQPNPDAAIDYTIVAMLESDLAAAQHDGDAEKVTETQALIESALSGNLVRDSLGGYALYRVDPS